MSTQLQERLPNPDPAATLSVVVGVVAFSIVYWRFFMQDEDSFYSPPEEDEDDSETLVSTSLVLAPDCATVVEFPDGSRRRRPGRFGEVGDTFAAYKYHGGWNSGG